MKAASKTTMSDFLFAHPSFFSGIARALDLGGTFDAYNESETPEEADARASHADWLAVGQDLWGAMSEADEELKPASGNQR